jgi:replicative DNA helicase
MVDVLGYLTSKDLHLKRADARNVHTACVFCNEDTSHRGRLYINIDPDAEPAGLYFCHLCQAKGSLASLKRHWGDQVNETELDHQVYAEILAFACDYYTRGLRQQPAVQAYLLGPRRGLAPETIASRQLGYAAMNVTRDLATRTTTVTKARHLYRALRDEGYSAKEILATGLCTDRDGTIIDALSGMVTIPYLTAGNVVTIRGRTWPATAEDFTAWDGPTYEPSPAKYKTLAGTSARLFNSDATWNSPEITIAEGELDCMVLAQEGYAAVGVPGATAWQDSWDDYLTNVRRVFVLYDTDAAGEKAAHKLVDRLGSKARRITLAEPGIKCDPTQWFATDGHTRDEFEALLADARRGSLLVTVHDARDEFARVQNTPGINFTWDAFDAAIEPGLQPAQILILLARTGVGKGHPLDTPVPTPEGMRLWGDLHEGDHVFGSDGNPTRVVAIYERGTLPIYRVTFSDGATVDTDPDHIWTVLYRQGHEQNWTPKNLTTAELAASDLRQGRSYRFTIPLCEALNYPERPLPVDPYTLGALIANGWLGGTTAVLTTPDHDVIARVNEVHSTHRLQKPPGACPAHVVHGVIGDIRRLGLTLKSAEKFIPEDYLTASIDQRVALLQGLFDGDGSTRAREGRSNSYYFTTSPRLAHDVQQLVTSLGGTATLRWHKRSDQRPLARLSVMLPQHINAFSTNRKALVADRKRRYLGPRRAIVAIERRDPQPVRCITVDAADSLYLIGRQHVVTHNTIALLNLMHRARMDPTQQDLKILFVSLEQTRGEWWDRVRRIHRFFQVDSNETEAARFWQDNLLIIDRNRLTEPELRQAIEDYAYQMGRTPDLMCIDYLGYFARGYRGEPYERTSNAVMAIKAIGKDYHVPIIVPHQVSRSGQSGQEFSGDNARDSVVGETLITLADGRRVPIADLVGTTPDVLALGDDHRFHIRTATRVWLKGTRPVYQLHTQTGRTLTCTGCHPLLTFNGWRPLQDLTVGDRIIVPRDLPVSGTDAFEHAELVGAVIADGGLTHSPVELTKGNPDIRAHVAQLARDFGLTVRARASQPMTLVFTRGDGHGRNPLVEYLRSIGAWGFKSPDRRVPEGVWTAPLDVAADFLRGLWSGDGHITDRGLCYSSASEGLARDVVALLLRFGISSVLTEEPYQQGGYKDGTYFRVAVRSSVDITAFAKQIGLAGLKGVALDSLAAEAAGRRRDQWDRIPPDVWRYIHERRRQQGLTWAETFGSTGVDERRGLSRERAQRIARQLGDQWLLDLADGHTRFDAITSIESAGERDVYDMTVPRDHNFVANEIVVSNSGVVEETADFLLTMWSPDHQLGREEDERSGQIHVRLAKSRHGGRGSLFTLQFAPISLVMLPEFDPLCGRARQEVVWRRKYGGDWEQAVYRHLTGFDGDLESGPKGRIREIGAR